MQKELNRNATLISTWTLADLPDLVRSKKAMADVYHPDPRLALARTQREAMISRLFTSFLTMELIKVGWLPSLSAEHGFTLTLGQTVLHPARLIQDLSEGKLDQKTFLRSIQSD